MGSALCRVGESVQCGGGDGICMLMFEKVLYRQNYLAKSSLSPFLERAFPVGPAGIVQ